MNFRTVKQQRYSRPRVGSGMGQRKRDQEPRRGYCSWYGFGPKSDLNILSWGSSMSSLVTGNQSVPLRQHQWADSKGQAVCAGTHWVQTMASKHPLASVLDAAPNQSSAAGETTNRGCLARSGKDCLLRSKVEKSTHLLSQGQKGHRDRFLPSDVDRVLDRMCSWKMVSFRLGSVHQRPEWLISEAGQSASIAESLGDGMFCGMGFLPQLPD